jgi:16S rRNA (cytidine1402-2'-O)-methyltransferase
MNNEFSKTFTLFGHLQLAPSLSPGLYIVATPIGNLGDISIRALATLAASDIILVEDKRVSKGLLTHYGIKTKMVSYHEHNAEAMRPEIMEKLSAGMSIAQISDAGTPLISDPGFKLVEAALEGGQTVVPIPGASAILTALVGAGLPTDKFFFEGFLPNKSAERRRRIRELEAVPGTLVFFEAPHRVEESLADLAAVLGDRPAAAARELTKKFEDIRRGSLNELAKAYANGAEMRGEFVLLVAASSCEDVVLSDADIDTHLQKAMITHSAKDAAAIVSANLGLQKRQVYARAIILQRATLLQSDK